MRSAPRCFLRDTLFESSVEPRGTCRFLQAAHSQRALSAVALGSTRKRRKERMQGWHVKLGLMEHDEITQIVLVSCLRTRSNSIELPVNRFVKVIGRRLLRIDACMAFVFNIGGEHCARARACARV